MSDLYRLVYASKNLLVGPDAEVAAAVLQILETSKPNNVKHDVTGALMFNGRSFAQVLEGPRRGVEATFERIQRDVRHSDVTVLQCGPVQTRGFPNWSMAFVGRSQRGQALWNGLAAESGFELSRLDGDNVFGMLHGLVLEEEVATDSAQRPGCAAPARPAPLPVAQVREEINGMRPDSPMKNPAAALPKPHPTAKPLEEGARSTRPTGSRPEAMDASLAVLKSALADERQRTTELRNKIDDLRVDLALGRDQMQSLREEALLWAARARLLASALVEKADAVGKDGRNEHEGDVERENRDGRRAA